MNREAWQPAIPLARVSATDRDAAQKLQRALARAFAYPPETSIAERARIAAPDYAREFGHAVSDRHLRALIARTVERDGGANAFARLEIYLPDACRERRAKGARVLVGAQLFAQLDEAFTTLADREKPTPAERSYCWRSALEWLQARIDSGTDEKTAKAELRAYLVRTAPFMGRNDNAVRVALDRKLLALAQQGESALFDRRAEKSGWRREVPDWNASILQLAKQTRIRHGDVSLAYRELYLGTAPSGERFSDGFRAHFSYNVRRAKSEVPARVRRAVAPMIAATDDLERGPRAAKLRLPSVHRDWSNVMAGEWHTADDVTVNHYWFEESEFGDYEFDGMRFNVGRGQWLILADERTDYPLGFVLLPTPSYNARDIKALCARAWMDEQIGLPFRGVTFERGIWKSLTVQSLFSWPAIDDGFARAGIKLRMRNATTPKAKIVERIIGAAQSGMDHLPGYVGRDEKKTRFERVQRFLESLKRVGQPRKADVDPREMLLGKEAFADEVVKTLRRFADEPQNGERLAGLSPAEAWRHLAPTGRAHVVLPESLRYLLATDRSTQTVTHEGIRIRTGAQVSYYVGSERLGELRGQKVEVYSNPELPECVTVIHRASDPRGVNPFSVPLMQRVPAMDATAEQFPGAHKAQSAFAKYGKGAFRLIAPPLNATVRNENLGSRELRDTGAAIGRVEREQITLRGERGRQGTAAARIAARHGVAIDPATIKNPARVLSAARNLDDLKARALRAEAEAEAQNHDQ